jgi:uncharacterized protein
MVKIPAVLDSACLIGLERVGMLDILPGLLYPIFAPPAVISEFGSCPDWISAVPVSDPGMVAAMRLSVDPGESEAITLAYSMSLRIILDDLKARQIAQKLGLSVTGTVGLVVKAKQAGIISSASEILDELVAHHFRISQSLYKEALRLAGE